MPSYITLPLTLGIKNVAEPDVTSAVTTKGYVDARISTASPNQPMVPVSGALWVDTSTSPYVLKVYFNNAWVTVSGGAASTAPTITGGTISSALATTYGTASSPVTFTVSGVNMTAGILVTAPTGLEVSQALVGTYSSTITVTGLGTIAATTVYVRLAATASIGNYNLQNIVLTSAGAAQVNVTTLSSGNNVTPVVITSEFTYTSTTSAVTITGYSNGGGAVTIPSTIDGLPVTSIGNNAFLNKTTITSVSIPSSVSSIGESAFSGCVGLTSLTIPTSVTSIGNYGFYGCDNIQTVAIPNTISTLGAGVFEMCVGLASVTIGSGINSISQRMFGNCVSLTSITIPSTITSIGANSFQNCIGLTSLTIPNSVTSIGNQAFNQCTNLTNVTIGNGLTSIGDSFSICTNLASVSFLGNVPTTTATWTGMTATVYRLSAATGWGTTFAGRPVAISGTTIVDNGYTTPTSNNADFYVAPNGTDYYVQPTIETNAYTFYGDILTFQSDTLTFAA